MLVNLLIRLDPLLKVLHCLFHSFVLIVLPIDLHILDVLLHKLLVIAHTLDPDQLVLVFDLLLQFVRYVFASLLVGIGPIKDGHFVLFLVYIKDKVLQTVLSNLLSEGVVLLIFRVEEVTRQLHLVI